MGHISIKAKVMLNLARCSAALLLAVATANAREWRIDMVDTTGAGRFSSMKIDRDGNAHVAYVIEDGNRNPLKYGFWDARLKRWFVMGVAEGAGPCSLTLDSKQRPHISYVDYGTASGSKLRYTWWDGMAWKKQAIPLNSDIIAYYNSIVLDREDKPTISFYEYRGPRDSEIKIRLRVVGWNGQQWNVRTVDPQEGSGKFNGLAIDAAGNLHLAYANVSTTTEGLRYARWDGKSWRSEILDSTGAYEGYSVAVTVDQEGDPHIVYSAMATGVVKYAVRKNGRWQLQIIDRVSAVGYPDRNSIALDEMGRPYVSYYDAARGTLTVAHKEAKGWIAEILDGNGAGFASSLQIHNGSIFVSYADEATHTLKVARGTIAEIKPSATAEVSQVSAK